MSSTDTNYDSGIDSCDCNVYFDPDALDVPATPRMKYMQDRLDTFIRWPIQMKQTPMDLAMSGFFYSGTNDRQQQLQQHASSLTEQGVGFTFEAIGSIPDGEAHEAVRDFELGVVFVVSYALKCPTHAQLDSCQGFVQARGCVWEMQQMEEMKNNMANIFTEAAKSVSTPENLDTPKSSVTAKHKGFEVRRYEACKWVSTKTVSMSLEDGMTTGFWKLFKYISGENDTKQKVEMTAPVATQVVPGAGPNCESTFTVSFYIPTEHQADPHKPTNPDVFISDWPEVKMAVKTFDGFANDSIWAAKGRELIEDVEKTDLKDMFVKEYYFTAGYDAPAKLTGRRNEVWFKIED
ncbi:heme-binding protein 2-like [Haliotis asinina]|uniref:heme-binding protein 2-like n=1 Tax=Haliotis asinina TaxID=109174 RepID=UPI0035323233